MICTRCYVAYHTTINNVGVYWQNNDIQQSALDINEKGLTAAYLQ